SEAAERVIPSGDELTARLTTLQRRMRSMLAQRAVAARRHVEQLARSRVLRNPRALIYDLSHRLDELDALAVRAIRRRLTLSRDSLAAIACRTEALSPLAVLARGYSVTTNTDNDAVISNARDVSLGQQVRTRFTSNSIISRVESIENGRP